MEKKKCSVCGRSDYHILKGQAKQGARVRPVYRNKAGKRWYDGRCNSCFLTYLRRRYGYGRTENLRRLRA